MTIDLRDYQSDAKRPVWGAYREGHRSVMLCSPTGSGKARIGMALFDHLSREGKSANFIVHRDVLLKQTSDRSSELSIPHGVVSGNETSGDLERIKVSSVQSMQARKIDPANFDINVIDEADVVFEYLAKHQRERGRWLGMSASPFRKGLAANPATDGELSGPFENGLYTTAINVAATDELIDDGWLAPLKIYFGTVIAPGRRKSSGEYDARESAENALKVVGDVLGEYTEKADEIFGRTPKTVLFSNTIHDAEAYAREFRGAGYDFRAIGYHLPQGEKDDLIKALETGEIDGLCSVDMVARGFDVPDVECLVNAQPRRSLSPVVQKFGRGMRIAPDKKFCLLLDFAQDTLRHRVPLFKFWAEGCDELIPLDRAKVQDNPEPGEAVCPECQALMTGPRCKECGWAKPRPQRTSTAATSGTMCVNGKLVPLDDADRRSHVVKIGRTEYEVPPPARGWQELCAIAKKKGKDADHGQKWCHAVFKEFYGHFIPARYFPDRHYATASPAMLGAVEHSKKLFIDKRKRETRRARQEQTQEMHASMV